MNIRRIAWLALTSIAVASWFSAASTPDVRTPTVIERTPSTRELDRAATVMQSEVTRLHDRITPAAIPSRSRDLFRFAGRPPHPPIKETVRMDVQTPDAAPEMPARPALQLIGVAEDQVADQTVRTAIISGLGDVFLVKSGDIVAGQYRVDQVSADAVQLVDTTTSALTTLALR